MDFKTLSKMPTSGQFVAVWEYDGKIFSQTYLWEGPLLYKLNEGVSKLYPTTPPDQLEHLSNMKYFSL